MLELYWPSRFIFSVFLRLAQAFDLFDASVVREFFNKFGKLLIYDDYYHFNNQFNFGPISALCSFSTAACSYVTINISMIFEKVPLEFFYLPSFFSFNFFISSISVFLNLSFFNCSYSLGLTILK